MNDLARLERFTTRTVYLLGWLLVTASCALAEVKLDATLISGEVGENLRQRAMRRLGAEHCSIQALRVNEESRWNRRNLRISVNLGGEPTTLILHPHSVRSKSFKLLVLRDDGAIEERVAPACETYRGQLLGRPHTRVAADIHNGRLNALIQTEDGSRWCIEPQALGEQEPTSNLYAVFEEADLTPGWGGVWNHSVRESFRLLS